MRVGLSVALALAIFGCDDGDGGGGDGGAGAGGGGGTATVPQPLEGDSPTWGHAGAYDRMRALTAASGFDKSNVGDPGPLVGSEATSPTNPDALSSLYYETDGLEEAVGRVRDRRPEVPRNDDAGSRIQQKVSLGLTLGFAAEGPASVRGGARWHGLLATRALDHYFLLTLYSGLEEHSAAGFDRAIGAVWDQNGDPHALGALLAEADAACGTTHLADIARALSEVRDDFAAELEASGLPDPLGRNVIEAGALPAYDAAILTVEAAATAGLGGAFLNLLSGEIDATVQASGLTAFDAISARVFAAGVEGADRIGALLDAANPQDVDVTEIRRLVGEALGVSCGG